eukprot:123873-Chlamydomonas_euryale.AAC.1
MAATIAAVGCCAAPKPRHSHSTTLRPESLTWQVVSRAAHASPRTQSPKGRHGGRSAVLYLHQRLRILQKVDLVGVQPRNTSIAAYAFSKRLTW